MKQGLDTDMPQNYRPVSNLPVLCKLLERAVIYGGRRGDHVTLLHDSLHWLRIREWITLKLCLLVYKATHGLAPSYIADMYVRRPRITMSTRRSLCSSASGDLLVPRTRVKFRNRAFAVAGPEAWNSLPVDIRSSKTVTAVKSRLNTQLFKLSYCT